MIRSSAYKRLPRAEFLFVPTHFQASAGVYEFVEGALRVWRGFSQRLMGIRRLSFPLTSSKDQLPFELRAIALKLFSYPRSSAESRRPKCTKYKYCTYCAYRKKRYLTHLAL